MCEHKMMTRSAESRIIGEFHDTRRITSEVEPRRLLSSQSIRESSEWEVLELTSSPSYCAAAG